MIRMLDHTADVGFELRTDSLESLFDEARRALLMVMFDHPPERGEGESTIRLSAPAPETLLVRWLNELIYCIQESGFVPVNANIRISEVGEEWTLEARVIGAPLNLEAYGWQGEIKSATFHDLNVLSTNEGWSATVILDV